MIVDFKMQGHTVSKIILYELQVYYCGFQFTRITVSLIKIDVSELHYYHYYSFQD